MVRIEVVTNIAAPVERCFDLSRSIDLHMASTNWTGERAIAGTISGLISFDQEVTWRGRHFGFRIHHTSRITAFDQPLHFQDCMVRGAFKSFCHDHYFGNVSGRTRMKDLMVFAVPLGLLGTLVEGFPDRHMRSLLDRRNQYIKRVAESDERCNFIPAERV